MTLATDPGPGFDEDTRVELVDPRINSYQIDSPDGRSISGLAFKAVGLNPPPRRLRQRAGARDEPPGRAWSGVSECGA